MKNNATIRVKSQRKLDDESIELVTGGAFYEKNGSWYILYEEKEEMGMANCNVMIKINDDGVIVTRKGDFSSKMVYKKGEATEFLYHMPYGTLPIILETRDINWSVNKSDAELIMTYFLSVNDENDENILKIKVISDIPND